MLGIKLNLSYKLIRSSSTTNYIHSYNSSPKQSLGQTYKTILKKQSFKRL